MDTRMSQAWVKTLNGIIIILVIAMIGCGGGGGGGSDGGGGGDGNGNNVALDVTFVPNQGGTCVASSFTMALKYYEPQVTFDQVYSIFGLPPFDNNEYENFNDWIIDNFELEIRHYANCIIDDVMDCIDDGYPAIVHQQDSLALAEGHMRAVIGYNLKKEQFIIHDPSQRGANYRESFSVFESLWELITNIEPVPPNRIILLVPIGKPSPLDPVE